MTQGQLDFTASDRKRLAKQAQVVLAYFQERRGEWVTLRTISEATGAPEASASARYRDLKAAGYPMERRRSEPSSGLWLYRMNAEVTRV